MKNSLEELFGSRERWRLIKLFLLNEKEKFTAQEIAKRNKVNGRKTVRILEQLTRANFICKRMKDKRKYFILNRQFPFFRELKDLVVRSNIYPQCKSLGKIKTLGKIKLGLISGVFINYPKSKTDLLIVGDSISHAKMKHLLEDLEAEMGREINYSLMSSSEFKYRTNMFDKFIMEILDSPYEVVVNKIANEIRQLLKVKKGGSS
ncbi:MAG: hypothetical protein U9M90_00210 [Patescibacteria group bacterium]|nr:hypothetical protein [Patescibacteria group bacterium]